MQWLSSPWGLGIVIVVILVLTALVCWKLEPIKKWLKRKELSEIEIGAGPVKAKFKDRPEKPESKSPSRPGVSFGEGNDFSGAKVHNVAGRDLLQGGAASSAPDGETPGVDFGKRGKFTDAEIENIAGRDSKEA